MPGPATAIGDRTLTAERLLILFPTKHLGNFLIAIQPLQTLVDLRNARGLPTYLAAQTQFTQLLPEQAGLTLIDFPAEVGRDAPALRRASLWIGFVKRLRALRPDVLVDLESTPRSSGIARWSGARFKIGRQRRKKPIRGFDVALTVSGSGRHAWHEFADMLGLEDRAGDTPVYGNLVNPFEGLKSIAARHPDLFGSATQRVVGVHAGATKDYKMWPLERFATVAGELADAGHRVLLLGAGAGDRANNTALVKQLGDRVVDLTNDLSLIELAALLSQLDAYLGNDSGPAHLAGSVGCPAVILFGPTDRDTWGPIAPTSTVLVEHCPCAPEARKRSCSNDYVCIRGISTQTVMRALAALTPRQR